MCPHKEAPAGRRRFGSIPFVLSAGLLLAAALGLRPGIEKLSDYYGKRPIDLRRALNQFDPARLPSFGRGWDITFRGVNEQDVGTAQYVHVSFERQADGGRPARAGLFVTYYNDPQDKVPHTPEVCSRQAGAVVETMETIDIDVPPLGPDRRHVTARLLILRERTHKTVDMYVFCVEGRFRYTRNQVRWVLGIPGNRYSYFCKIEAAAMFDLDEDPAAALEAGKTILAEALPILVSEFLPTAEQLSRR